jgi:hypothetical protein
VRAGADRKHDSKPLDASACKETHRPRHTSAHTKARPSVGPHASTWRPGQSSLNADAKPYKPSEKPESGRRERPVHKANGAQATKPKAAKNAALAELEARLQAARKAQVEAREKRLRVEEQKQQREAMRRHKQEREDASARQAAELLAASMETSGAALARLQQGMPALMLQAAPVSS